MRGLLTGETQDKGLSLDPRTKMAILITIAVFVLGGAYNSYMRYYTLLLVAIPLVLLIFQRKWKAVLIYSLFLFLGLFLRQIKLGLMGGLLGFISLAVEIFSMRVLPSVVMGYYVFTTTRVSEFIAAMEKLHMPKQITIPLSVLFRFFPTVVEEWRSIQNAIKMRGVKILGSNPLVFFEYCFVPMIICSVRIGEELNVAALTRGLGGPIKRTNICKIEFKFQDFILILICLGAFALDLFIRLGG